MFWLREDVVLLSPSRVGLDLLLDQVELFRKRLLKANRLLREQSRNPIYAERYSLLISVSRHMAVFTPIPGIEISRE